jgi:hypothetical protein
VRVLLEVAQCRFFPHFDYRCAYECIAVDSLAAAVASAPGARSIPSLISSSGAGGGGGDDRCRQVEEAGSRSPRP